MFFFFKQKTAYEMRISDWSSDVCSSDLAQPRHGIVHHACDPGLVGDVDDRGLDTSRPECGRDGLGEPFLVAVHREDAGSPAQQPAYSRRPDARGCTRHEPVRPTHTVHTSPGGTLSPGPPPAHPHPGP